MGFESRQSARSTCLLHFISVCFCRIQDLNSKLNTYMTQFHPMLMTVSPTVLWSWGALSPPKDTELLLVRELAEVCTQQEFNKCLRKERRNKQERKEVESRKNKGMVSLEWSLTPFCSLFLSASTDERTDLISTVCFFTKSSRRFISWSLRCFFLFCLMFDFVKVFHIFASYIPSQCMLLSWSTKRKRACKTTRVERTGNHHFSLCNFYNVDY